MALIKPAVVANTDQRWFAHFRSESRSGRVDEVNFWRPAAQSGFSALDPGEPFFFRLKTPHKAIAGFGYFAVSAPMSVQLAWEIFSDRNGETSERDFVERIQTYRERFGRAARAPLSCIVLREAVFLPRSLWIPWGLDEEWSPNLVSFKRYDLATGVGKALEALVSGTSPELVPDLLPDFQLVSEADAPEQEIKSTAGWRPGQGTFRLRLLNAYDRKCAITGEHALPVLDAAHIQRYLGPASNHPQNGIVLRHGYPQALRCRVRDGDARTAARGQFPTA